MKRFLMLGFCLTALTACDTLSMPSLSSLNPFGSDGKTVKESPKAQDNTLIPMPATDHDALETELAEMQHLTGSAPRFDNRGTQTTFIEETVTEIPEAEIALTEERVAEINQQLKAQIEPTPAPPSKPQAPVKQAEVIEPEKQPEPVQEPTPAIQEPMAVMAQQDIAPVQAQPVTPENTNETAIFTEQDLKLSSAKGCPQVKIMPAGRSITYFENEMSARMVARAVINEIRGGCEIVNGGMEIDLDILMHGRITDKGRFEGRKDMEAFMTFPYFVAVTTPQGLPVDKKILATAMRFQPLTNDLHHAEKITQFIPMSNTGEAANYTITVGYQLNRKQLEYNRAQNINRVDNRRVAPDLRNRSRLSPDPLAGE